MRVPLPHLKPNGAAIPAGQVFAITGLCQSPRFRLSALPSEFCLLELGGDDPYVLLRRSYDHGDAVAMVRVEWEGVFTLLANDDECAEELFRSVLAPATPEEAQRQWTMEEETMELFVSWLRLS